MTVRYLFDHYLKVYIKDFKDKIIFLVFKKCFLVIIWQIMVLYKFRAKYSLILELCGMFYLGIPYRSSGRTLCSAATASCYLL